MKVASLPLLERKVVLCLAFMLTSIFGHFGSANAQTAEPPSAGEFSFSSSFYTVTENETDQGPFNSIPPIQLPTLSARSARGALLTVIRTGGAAGRVKIDYTTVDGTAVEGIDYLARSGTLEFDDYQMSTNILIPIKRTPADTNMEAYLDFQVVLSNPRPFDEEDPTLIVPTLGDDTAIVEIQKVNSMADSFSIERVNYRIDEFGDLTPRYQSDPYNRTNISIDIILPGGEGGSVRVRTFVGGDYSFPLNAGSDYAEGRTFNHANPTYTDGSDPIVNLQDFDPFGAITVNFAKDETRQRVMIPIRKDLDVEFNEEFEVWLDNPSTGRGIGNGEATVTILTDDEPAGAADREWNSDNVARTIPAFNQTPGANNTVRSVAVQGDGKTVLAGDFTAVNTVTRNRIARMTLDGALDSTFDPGTGFDGGVDVVIAQPDGKILAAGGFTSFNGTQRNGIARLNDDGSLDTSFNPGTGLDGRVRAMVVQADGQIVIAGEFFNFNGEIRNGIARLNVDGSLDESFDAGFGPDATIWAVALQPGDFGTQKIIVGGDFTFFSDELLPGLARLHPDGAVDFSFSAGRGANNSVYALAVQADGKILVGGAFTELDVFNRNSIGRLNLDGDVDTTYDPGDGFDDSVFTILIQPNGRALVGGVFREFNHTRRIGMARLKVNGTLDTTFMDTGYNQFAGIINPFHFQPPNFVNSIAIQDDGNVLIGGSFKRIGGNPSSDMALRNAYTKYTRADIRPRYNIARLIGNVTPGPGNMEYIPTPYRVDEDAGTMAVTLRRIDGRLGTALVTSATTNNIAVADLDYTEVAVEEEWIEDRYVAPVSVGDVGFLYTRIPILDDALIEGDETLHLGLTDPIGSVTLGGEYIPLGAALGVRNSLLTIVDNDFEHGVFAFNSPTYTVNENGVRATITVVRTNGSSGAVSVDYFTKPGLSPEATPGQDYTHVSGTLSFASGQTTRTFTIPVTDDLLVELDENILITLTNAVGGAKLPAGLPTSNLEANLAIIDNDFGAGRINFTSVVYTNREDVGNAIVTVTRSGGNVGVLSVDYTISNGTAVKGPDYSASNGTLTWNNGDTAPKTFTVSLNGPDQLIEGTETIQLALTNATIAGALGGRTNAILYIEDADAFGALSFSQVDYAADENGASASIIVIRSGGIAGSVSVDYSATPGSAVLGTDYTAVSGTLTFAPGQTSTNFFVPVINDVVMDGDKTVQLQLSAFVNASHGVFTNAVLTLIDDESFSIPAGSLDSTFDQNVKADNAVHGLSLQPDGKLLIAGDFSKINDVTRTRIARLRDTGILDNTFNPGTGANDSVRSIVLQADGRVLVGGFFTTINETNRNRIARLRTDGSVDESFNPGSGANNPVYSITLQSDHKILLGGAFNTYNGVSRAGVVRVNTNGTLDASFNPGTAANGPVYAVAVQNDGKILVGGDFTSFNGASRSYLVRLNADGTRDNAFTNVALNAAVRAIHVQPDGKVVIGGSFTSVGGSARGYLARLNANGTLDSSFLAGGLVGANNSVYAIAQQIDGKLLVAGDFTRFNTVTRNRLTRLLSDGTTDATINFGTGANNFINALLIQPDRKIVFAGGFTTYNNQTRKYMARVHGGSMVGAGGLEFSAPIYTQVENATNVLITVTRVGGTTGEVTVNYSTSNGSAIAGTHYLAASGALTFPQGEVVKEFNIALFDDTVVNIDRTVNLSLSGYTGGATNGPQSSATLVLVNNDSLINFASATFTVNENVTGGEATISVARSGATNTVAQIQYAVTSGGTAISGVDFTATSGILTFLPGETLKNFHIAIANDTAIEPNETVNLALSSPSPSGSVYLGSPATASLTIVDNDFGPGEISFALNNFFANEFSPNAAVTLVRSNGNSGVVSVRLTTTNLTALAGQDYLSTNNVVSFADGESSKIFYITLLNDSVLESNESFGITLSEPLGGVTLGSLSTAAVTVLDDDASIVPAGFALVSESILPTNSVIDPNETVQMLFGLRNAGRVHVTNLTARLISTNGVSSPTATLVYGPMPTNGSVVSREFTFTAQGTNGSRITPTLELWDGPRLLGTAAFQFTLGQASAVFANTNAIVVTDNSPANPYPSTIHVSGVAGPITKLTVTVKNVTHSFPADLDMLLVGPGGQRVLLMANSGGNSSNAINNVTITFDDAAASSLPQSGQIVTGSYKPTRYGLPYFPNAPAAPYSSTLAAFNNTLANGAWNLYVIDDLGQDAGMIAGGWSLALTTKDVIVPAVDLAAQISANATVNSADPISYTVSITNHGPGSATNVTVVNNFGFGVNLYSISPNATAFQTASESITITLSNPLASGATTIVTLTVVADTSGTLTNVAVVGTSQGDPNSSNNTATATTTVIASSAQVSATFNGSNLILRWSTSSFGLKLLKSTDLINWVEETQAPTTDGNEYVLTVDVGVEAKLFYRLGNP